VRYLLDLTNRRGPTGFSDFYLPELSGPENRATMTRFVTDCRSNGRGHVPGQTQTEPPTEPLQVFLSQYGRDPFALGKRSADSSANA
jgi:hypothetical protein